MKLVHNPWAEPLMEFSECDEKTGIQTVLVNESSTNTKTYY